MKKIKFSEASKEKVYTDEYGWISLKIRFTVTASIGNQSDNRRSFSQDRVYVKDGHDFRHFTAAEALNINKNHLYVNSNPNYYISERTAVEIFDSEVTVERTVIGKSIEELANIEVYEFETNEYTPHILMDYEILPEMLVRVGDSGGTYMVTECFEQPNRENKLCIVEPLVTFEGDKRQAIVINTESKQLYTVPYAEYAEMPNELDVFNHPIREPELQPICHMGRVHRESSVNQTNLFWQPIEEAGAYTVSLYYYNSSEQLKNKLYLLQRFEVERNVHWLTIENLMGGCKFIVMLEAEDRQGNIIARTRGIDVANGKPQWW